MESDFSSLLSSLTPQQASMVEDLIFELRVERLKTEKLRKEWQQKKKQYED